jgi:hypothetical protein
MCENSTPDRRSSFSVLMYVRGKFVAIDCKPKRNSSSEYYVVTSPQYPDFRLILTSALNFELKALKALRAREIALCK